MRDGKPSLTASFVSFARAAASARPMTTSALEDPIAQRLFSWPRSGLGQSLARVLSLGLVDHIALRSAAIDEALSAGFAQLVLLGAGLDARAYRLRSVAGARVFEVDHPASQRVKRRYARGLTPRAAAVEYVAADFLHDDVDARLEEAGHDPAVPTAWVIEGVATYLPADVTSHLLSMIAQRSARDSILALTYVHASRAPLARKVGGVMLRAMGEALGQAYSRVEIERRVDAAGLEVESNTNNVDWSVRFGASASLARAFRDEWLVLARKPRVTSPGRARPHRP